MKVICWNGKGLKKCMQNVRRCINCQQKCTQYVYRSIYICTINRKTSFTVSSLCEPHHWRSGISSRKDRHIGKAQSIVWDRFYKYTCHVSTRLCTCLQFFNSLHAFKAFGNVVHSGLTFLRSSASHPCQSRRWIFLSVVCSLTKYNSEVLL